MTTITVSLDEATYASLERVARQREARPEDLLRSYAGYLAEGGEPLPTEDDIPVRGIMLLAEKSGAFDWLNDEPDLYSGVRLEPFG